MSSRAQMRAETATADGAEPSIGPLITGVIVVVVAAILFVTFARPGWLPERIRLENAVLMTSIGVLGVVLFALLLRIHDISRIHHELLKTRELAALREHERDQAQQALLAKLEGQVLTKPFTSAELMRRIAQAAAQLTLRDAVPVP